MNVTDKKAPIQNQFIATSAEDLLFLGNAFVISRALHIVVEQKIADFFEKDKPVKIEVIAQKLNFSAIALQRILRVLCPIGIFIEHTQDCFSLSEIGEYLKSNHPSGMRDLLFCDESRWNSFGKMDHTLKTGSASFSKIYQMGYFDYLADRPELQKAFDDHMKAVSAEEDPILAKALPINQKNFCIDIGGGKGGLIQAILDLNPHIRGGVFELPEVAQEKLSELSKMYQGRFEVFSGSFFDELPFQSDALVLKRILHDWDDAHCIQILSNCQKALSDQGELYIMETVLKGREDSPLTRIFDLLLLTVFGGIERTREDYKILFEKAGLQLKQMIPTEIGMSILVVSKLLRS